MAVFCISFDHIPPFPLSLCSDCALFARTPTLLAKILPRIYIQFDLWSNINCIKPLVERCQRCQSHGTYIGLCVAWTKMIYNRQPNSLHLFLPLFSAGLCWLALLLRYFFYVWTCVQADFSKCAPLFSLRHSFLPVFLAPTSAVVLFFWFPFIRRFASTQAWVCSAMTLISVIWQLVSIDDSNQAHWTQHLSDFTAEMIVQHIRWAFMNFKAPRSVWEWFMCAHGFEIPQDFFAKDKMHMSPACRYATPWMAGLNCSLVGSIKPRRISAATRVYETAHPTKITRCMRFSGRHISVLFIFVRP